jgi:hypothetical protein
MLHDEDFTIVEKYGAEYRGMVQYYLLAHNVHRLSQLHWVMSVSLLKTLAAKHKSTVQKMATKHSAVVSTDSGQRKCIQVTVQREGRKSLTARFGGIPLQRQRTATLVDKSPLTVSPKNELIHRLLAEKCEHCGNVANLEVHHIRKLADLNKPGRPERSWWIRQMASRRRKTLVVCTGCHDEIHAGRATSSTRKTPLESRVSGN